MKFKSKFYRAGLSTAAEYTPTNLIYAAALSFCEAREYTRRNDNHRAFVKTLNGREYVVKEITYGKLTPNYEWIGPLGRVERLGLFYTLSHAQY